MTITFKGSEALNQAIIHAAANDGHGNKSKFIIDTLMLNPLVLKKVKDFEKKLKNNSK